MKKEKVFSGVATALITPFRRGRVDYAALSRLVELQIGAGIDALVIGGTTGEAATLSDAERYEVYSFVKERVGGRARLIFGTGTNDTRIAIRHTRSAEDIGCDGVLVVTPYYNKGTHDGVVRHYREISDATSLPIILYNVPSRTGVNLTVKQLSCLAERENIVGIKEASDSLDRLVELSKFGEDLWLYAGNDSQIYSTLSLGGAGVISVVSNLYPKSILNITKSYFSGDTGASLRAQQDIFNFTRAMFLETNPSPIKYAMSLSELSMPEVRLPLFKPTKEVQRAIKREMQALSERGLGV